MKAEDVAEKAQLAELQKKISELETDDAADEEEKAAFRAQLQRYMISTLDSRLFRAISSSDYTFLNIPFRCSNSVSNSLPSRY